MSDEVVKTIEEIKTRIYIIDEKINTISNTLYDLLHRIENDGSRSSRAREIVKRCLMNRKEL